MVYKYCEFILVASIVQSVRLQCYSKYKVSVLNICILPMSKEMKMFCLPIFFMLQPKSTYKKMSHFTRSSYAKTTTKWKNSSITSVCFENYSSLRRFLLFEIFQKTVDFPKMHFFVDFRALL